ncbi:MAG: hypothetical protein A2937_00925 [Candidatus Yonathbacteria bacterium RIFCSPLOWO2_01_FULL_47_33b]|uniref:Uncharacterized protein n=1 Tax=Candidatus Yonathbacteria bacterium RIFCSPLOWO2_01_FULL_47_33b TaxID=1802727 RepID=A0A1G2SGG0_9BACT|nr:MAG: hypothetical protein A2937_00925 [Candidatus Yonathbacteria bacterium RIFCSPLOWO2_01_FULL_47_33b]
MTTKVLDFSNIDRKLFWAFAGFLALALSFYLYSVLSLTMSVVERDRTASAVRELAAHTGALEAEYLGLQNTVTLAYAQGLGLEEVSVKFAGNTNAKISLAR